MGKRRRINITSENYLPFNRYGNALEGVEWLPLSGGSDQDKEVYIIRFGPGCCSSPHIHQGSEEFLVLEGELIDDDETVFLPDDFVRFEPGTQHSSCSGKGCTLLVILAGGTNKVIDV